MFNWTTRDFVTFCICVVCIFGALGVGVEHLYIWLAAHLRWV